MRKSLRTSNKKTVINKSYEASCIKMAQPIKIEPVFESNFFQQTVSLYDSI